ncbi:conserved hypothetical protein [Ricinus communis]|uniref:Uncharacterized protein n=1 Tax=Ricinus communis TaxID=3988 RepID=B9SU19_RICCO|nr:conserved hypothetical protein [Ricinus communis]
MKPSFNFAPRAILTASGVMTSKGSMSSTWLLLPSMKPSFNFAPRAISTASGIVTSKASMGIIWLLLLLMKPSFNFVPRAILTTSGVVTSDLHYLYSCIPLPHHLPFLQLVYCLKNNTISLTILDLPL